MYTKTAQPDLQTVSDTVSVPRSESVPENSMPEDLWVLKGFAPTSISFTATAILWPTMQTVKKNFISKTYKKTGLSPRFYLIQAPFAPSLNESIVVFVAINPEPG